SAKVSFRLVHQQDPEKIRTALHAFVKERLPADCRVEFEPHGAGAAIQLPFDAPMVTKAKSALSDEWGKQAEIIAMGGSIPIVGVFQSMLGMESLLVGFGLDDDRIHSPNEKYNITSFHKGQRSWARILDAIAS
ncbi:MAG: M20/M25/M40 family metallo-hydrolase, partial [Hyphomicrobiaceae bacterium]|nr:M20/M25/M40 family metallo-hydrolase [Hyphomicrobiaceae bacterium]